MTAISESETLEDIQREDHIADLLLDGKSPIEVAFETGTSEADIRRIARERHILEGEQAEKNAAAQGEDEVRPLFEEKVPARRTEKKYSTQKYSDAINTVVDFLRRNPGSYSRMRMKAIIRKECPGVESQGRVLNAMVAGGYIVRDPEKDYKAYIPSWPPAVVTESQARAGDKESTVTQVNPRSVMCPDKACSVMIEARSQGSKVRTLLWSHLHHGPRKELPDSQRRRLMRLALPDYRPREIDEQAEAPSAHTEQPIVKSASAVICPACEKEVMALLARAGLKFRSEVFGFRITIEGVGK